nr:hypothetical protein B0A51_12521 [Rachicladosporium sp. CCFEE 5018]
MSRRFAEATRQSSSTHSHSLIIGRAVTELMSPKSKAMKPDAATEKSKAMGRSGLVAYIKDPDSFPSSRVIYSNEKFVVINDAYSKSIVHTLILPRDLKKSVMRPQEAFDDSAFLEECVAEEKKVRKLVATELRRRFGRQSASDRPLIEALESDDPPEQLPPGRDWEKEVVSGIHSNPSMGNLHIHVMSREFCGEKMKMTNHYQSFTTDFLVPLDQFPLTKHDHRRQYSWMPVDMICWRCGKNFGNRMLRLKEHLELEKDEWIKE